MSIYSRYSRRIGLKKKTLNLSGKCDPIVISLCLEDGRESLFPRREWVLGVKPATRYVYTTLEILVQNFWDRAAKLRCPAGLHCRSIFTYSFCQR